MADHPPSVTVETSLSVEPHRFAIVPEWVLDSQISDAAVRLYAVLARYGGTSGQRMPSRATLAARLGKKSVDTVDRALRELETIGAVEVERRSEGGQQLTNRYHVRTSNPFGGEGNRARPVDDRDPGGRRDAATPSVDVQVVSGSDGSGSRSPAATGRTDAARVAAGMRHNPEVLTQRETSPSMPSPRAEIPSTETTEEAEAGSKPADRRRAILDACGIDDLDALAAQIADLRRSLGKPTGRWNAHCVHAAIALAVQRGWPADQTVRALLAVASDPATVSPMRLAEAGPWWDEPTTTPAPTVDEDELAELEARLAATDGLRVQLQRRARDQLTAEGFPLSRSTVLRRAADLLAATEREL